MCLLVECYDIVAATGEVDAPAQASNGERTAEDDSGDAPDGEGLLVYAHEIVVGVLHQILRIACHEGEVCPLVLAQHVVIDDTRHEYGSEEGYENTDDPGCGETLHRTCTEVEQDDTCDQ